MKHKAPEKLDKLDNSLRSCGGQNGVFNPPEFIHLLILAHFQFVRKEELVEKASKFRMRSKYHEKKVFCLAEVENLIYH